MSTEDANRQVKPKIGCGGCLAISAVAFIALTVVVSQLSPSEQRKPLADLQPTASASASAEAERKRADILSGEHCLSGWDGSFPRLKAAVKRQLRNPSSFDHDETQRTPVGPDGKFGLIMMYRAENGFGGLNVESVAVEVDAKSCEFRRSTNARVVRRMKKAAAN